MGTFNINRKYEYLRALAIFGVVTIHTVFSAILLFGDKVTLGKVICYRVIMNMMWWAVPCFLMITGSLLLNSKKEISLKRIYEKYIFRMLIVLGVFGVLFSWLELFFSQKRIHFFQIAQAFLDVIEGKTWAHMWYIYCLIGVYVLLPIYRVIAQYASDLVIKYTLFVFVIFLSLVKLLAGFGVELGFYVHDNSIFLFWLLMGVAWNRNMFKWNYWLSLVALVSSSVCMILLSIANLRYGIPVSNLFGYDSILVIIQATCIWHLVNCWIPIRIIDKFLIEIGQTSFGIYLTHMVFVNLIYKVFKINPFIYFGGLSIFILIIVVLVASYLLTKVLKRMPIMKNLV